MKKKKITPHYSKKIALSIKREALKSKLVYIALANKEIHYGTKRSRIVYIGKTKKGAKRIASSAAHQASEIFNLHSIKQLDFYIVTWNRKSGQKGLEGKLEKDLILTFKKKFGCVPIRNIQYKKADVDKTSGEFTPIMLEKIIDTYSHWNKYFDLL